MILKNNALWTLTSCNRVPSFTISTAKWHYSSGRCQSPGTGLDSRKVTGSSCLCELLWYTHVRYWRYFVFAQYGSGGRNQQGTREIPHHWSTCLARRWAKDETEHELVGALGLVLDHAGSGSKRKNGTHANRYFVARNSQEFQGRIIMWLEKEGPTQCMRVVVCLVWIGASSRSGVDVAFAVQQLAVIHWPV